ncbi:MAG: cadherin-like domain-containing protein, partial [Alphaproteobacteria bacterium]|nr:cadherin-like domain-containing protein [Alphaproteobacteria bacterium]
LFSVTTNGQVTFDPNGDFEHLADGETLTTSYTYTLTDNEGGTDTATISVEVTGVNVAPIAQPHENTTPERTAVSGQLTATDIDGGELRYTIADRPQNGQATVNPDGSYTYVPAEGFQGVDTFTVQVDDGHGGKVSLVVTINVTPNPGAGFEQFLPVELRDGLPGPFKLSADFFSGDNNDLSQSGGIGELPGDNTELTQNGIILDTVNGIEDLGGIGAVTGSILASTDPDRLDQLARQATQTFGSSAGFWNSQSLTGFSLRAEISGIPAAGDATRNGQIIVDTIIKDRIIYIEMSNDLNHSQHGPVTEYAIKQADGRPLPDWAKQAQNGLLLAEPPPGQKVLETEIVAVLEDGTSITHRVAIQLASGEVRLIGQSDAPHAPTFQQQIDDAARTGADEIRDLGQSVITNPSQ